MCELSVAVLSHTRFANPVGEGGTSAGHLRRRGDVCRSLAGGQAGP